MNKIWLSPPHMNGAEKKYVDEAFELNWIAPGGSNTKAFEELLSHYTGCYAHAVNSGTSALHLALCVLDIKADDIVFCQSLTFAASAFPILYMGATPVFIDSEIQTWNIDPYLLEEALELYEKKGKLPKAIIITHIYGMPADMNLIQLIAAKYNVPIIEDAAEAIGSLYNNKPCGSLADLSIYSFNGNKILTTGGGGALMSRNQSFIDDARKFSNQSKEKVLYYEHQKIGFNYAISNVSAGIGRGQFETLPQRVDRKREIFNHYKSYLSEFYEFDFQHENEYSKSNRWLSVFLFDSKNLNHHRIEKIIHQFASANVECRCVWKPMHRQPVFKDFPAFVNGVSDKLFATGICFPSGTAMTDSQIEYVSSLIDKFIISEKDFA
jgi:dTDP-4-amino-4,6-dideoxygalactose transaminase